MTANHNSNIKAAAAAVEGDEDREREKGGESESTVHRMAMDIMSRSAHNSAYTQPFLMDNWCLCSPRLSVFGPGPGAGAGAGAGPGSLRMLLLSPEHDISH